MANPKRADDGQSEEPRVVGIFQDIDEKKAEEVIYAFRLYLSDSDKDIELYISTDGGRASDMFSIYDFMREAKSKVDIVTFGLGKVMSAGVLLLAAGTKGKRKVGRTCRIMLHSVVAGNAGPLHDLKNEMKETQKIQDLYIKALCAHTNFTPTVLKKLFMKNVNVYLSAEEAVERGIADIIV